MVPAGPTPALLQTGAGELEMWMANTFEPPEICEECWLSIMTMEKIQEGHNYQRKTIWN
jgi:hypothetical protein